MKTSCLRFIMAVVLILSELTLFARPVAASELTLTQPLVHDGLAFSTPLTFTKMTTLTPLTITFTDPTELVVTDTAKPEVKAEQIVSPTPVKAVLAAATIAPLSQEITEAIDTPTPRPEADQPLAETTTPTSPQTPTAVLAAANSGGLDADKLFAMSNAYRASKGLPAFQKDDRACSLAQSRAPEVQAEVDSGTMHTGLRARNLPYWNTENIITMQTEEQAFTWWINDTIHREAIEGNYTYSCVACAGHACAQEFTNFQAK